MECHVSYSINELLNLTLEDIEKRFGISRQLLYNYYMTEPGNFVPLDKQLVFHIDYKDGAEHE